MQDNTNYTPPVEDNLLGLTDRFEVNAHEARGIAKAELFIIGLDTNTEISVSLILQLHKIAFGELYDWAGKWRNTIVNVGSYVPPEPQHLPNLMYQCVDQVKYQHQNAKTRDDVLNLLCYSHHRLVFIHPFNNGNGRLARLFTNFLCLLHGYKPIELYRREGVDRKLYIEAIQEADKANFNKLRSLIDKELTIF